MNRTVLLVADNLGLSGKTKALADLARGLDRARYRPEVCILENETSPLPALLRGEGIKVHHVECRKGFDIDGLSRFVRMLRTVKPDIVHCYNPRPILYAGAIARCLGAGVLGSLSAFACQVPDRQYAFLPKELHTKSLKNVARNQVCAQVVGAFAVVSPALGQRFCRYNRISSRKVRVVPYGVRVQQPRSSAARTELATHVRQELGFGPDTVIIGSVGRLVEQKDYPTQFRGFALAARTDPRLRMVLAGDGPLRAELEQLAAELGIATRVAFLGYRADVPRLLVACDIFVMTSKFEPFGVSLLEAKAAGCSILATSVNEISEIVPHGRAGLLFSSGDSSEMAARLLQLAGNPALRERLGQQALDEASEKHSLPAMITAYQALYDELAPVTTRF
ncbi:MAG: hypothetical protein JWO36_5504 [Myxococcales bacterium]|nr:hypothetical protein [Myxococcales bacterium]